MPLGIRPQWPGLDLLQSREHPEAGPDARMVDEEVQVRPVLGRLSDVGGVAVLGIVRWVGREPFVDAEIEEAGMVLELLLVSGDDLVDGVGHDLVVETPSGHEAIRIRVDLRRRRDVVALPRVRMEIVDLPLRVVAEKRVLEIADSRVDLGVGEHAL